MLFLLTGKIQTGKTRWLESALGALEADSVRTAGVIAPGMWRTRQDGTFEKLGIENVLLPDGERLKFALRRDLAGNEGHASSQSLRAGLGWAIDDSAIDRVDEHFKRLAREAAQWNGPERRALLVIDELGRLELMHNGGLVSAMALLGGGATPAFPHALAIVREELLPTAFERFPDELWNGRCTLHPGEKSLATLLATF